MVDIRAVYLLPGHDRLLETDLKKTLQLGQQAYLEPGFEVTWNMGV